MPMQKNYLPIIKKVNITLFIIGIIFIGLFILLSEPINAFNVLFYTFTICYYMGFVLIILSAIFSLLYLLKIQRLLVYISTICVSGGIFMFIVNQFVTMQTFFRYFDPEAELHLKLFDPLYAVLLCALGFTLLMFEIVRYLYLTPRINPY